VAPEGNIREELLLLLRKVTSAAGIRLKVWLSEAQIAANTHGILGTPQDGGAFFGLETVCNTWVM